MKVSWRYEYCQRRYGEFVRWQGSHAIVRFGAGKVRVHKSNVTFEKG